MFFSLEHSMASSLNLFVGIFLFFSLHLVTCTHCKPSGVQACMYTVEVTKRVKIPTNNSRQLGEHGYSISRADDFVLFIIEDNYSQLIQYEILQKLVTYM